MGLSEREITTQIQPSIDEDIWRQQEAKRIYAETRTERGWWASYQVFDTREEAESAVERGHLVVVPSRGDNYRLIRRLNGQPDGEPYFLRPEAYVLLVEALAIWRSELDEEDKHIKLAVTSLYRDSAVQRGLQQGEIGYNSLTPEESSHLRGGAFDISVRSYYEECPETEVKGIQSWNPSTGTFKSELFVKLAGVFTRLADEGRCNFVVENRYDHTGKVEPTVFHIGVNPHPPQKNRFVRKAN